MEENSSQTSSIQVQQHTIGHHQANSYALSRNYQSTNQETPSYYYDTGIHGSMTSGNHPTHTMHYVPAQPMARSYPDEQVYMQQNVYDYQPQSGGMFHQHPQTSHQVPVPQTGHPEQVLQSYSYNNNSHVAKSFESSPTLQASSTIPQGIEDDQSSGGGGGNTSQGKTSDKSNLYKTELCRKWTQTGFCRYGDKCQFAHGLYELRATVKHPLYKTTPCKSFQAHGTCRYGNRCRFIHDESEYELAHVPRGVPAQNLSVDTTSGRASLVPVGPASQSFPSPTLSPESVPDPITIPQQQQYQLPRKEVGSPVLAARSRSMAPGSPSVQSSRRSSTVQRTSPPGSPASRPIGIHGAIHRVPSAPASMGIVHSQSVPEHFASEFSSLSIQSSPMSSQMKQRQQLQNHYGSSGSARSPLLRPSHSYQSLETHAEYPPQQSRSPHNTRGEFGETLLHSASTQSLSSHFAGHQQSSSVGKSGSLPRPPLVGRGMTNSASFSERILPSFCLPLAPKMGYARQSSMTQLASLGRSRDDDDTANARLEATAKAFGRPSLDLNSNTFSSPEIDHPQLQQSNDQSVSTPLGSQRSLNSNKDSEANNNTSKDRMMWETMFQAAPGAWDDTPYTQQATSSSPMSPTPEGSSARPSF